MVARPHALGGPLALRRPYTRLGSHSLDVWYVCHRGQLWEFCIRYDFLTL